MHEQTERARHHEEAEAHAGKESGIRKRTNQPKGAANEGRCAWYAPKRNATHSSVQTN